VNDLVLSQRKDGIAILTLNRPERLNAINDALVQALRRALSAALADAESRVILLTGAGRAFCSGDDLEDFPAQSRTGDVARRYLNDLQDVTRLMVMGEKMVVGAVHGWAVGGRSEYVTMAAENGQDYNWHMASVVRSTIKNPANLAKLAEMRKDHWEHYWPITESNYEYMMEPAIFPSVIKTMVDNHMFLAPTLTHTWWGWGTQIPHAKEWADEIIAFNKNTQGIDFVPQRVRLMPHARRAGGARRSAAG